MVRCERLARKVGAIVDFCRRLCGQEAVLELQHLRDTAGQVAGAGVDRDAHQVIAGAVDQLPVLVELEVAATGVLIDSAESRPVVGKAVRLLDHKEAEPVNRHEGGDRRTLDVALYTISRRELATTSPANCLEGTLSGIRSSKLVSMRLNAVVCKLAMLPEMFSSANNCARIPVTAVVRAPKIPMICSPLSHARKLVGSANTSRGHAAASLVPWKLYNNINTS